MNSNHIFFPYWSQGEKDNWDVIEDDNPETGETVVGIGDEEKDEHDIEQYGHVLESGNKEENENSDDLAKEINDEIVTSNESESSNTVIGKWFIVVHYLMCIISSENKM